MHSKTTRKKEKRDEGEVKSYQQNSRNQPENHKEKVPLHSLKENKPDVYVNCQVYHAHAHACGRAPTRERLIKRTAEALVAEALELTGGRRGPKPSDEAIWANFGWIIGWRKFRDCLDRARGDIGEKTARGHAFTPRERVKILQTILNPWWQQAKGGRK